VLEELQELGNHDVERAVENVAVQDLCRVLTDLLQRSERTLPEEDEEQIGPSLKSSKFKVAVHELCSATWTKKGHNRGPHTTICHHLF
jgi:hypothetical protein